MRIALMSVLLLHSTRFGVIAYHVIRAKVGSEMVLHCELGMTGSYLSEFGTIGMASRPL